MPHVQVNGKSAFYASPRDIAAGQKKGKIVLLVHGARSNHRIWAPQLQALAPWHTPIAMDLPGHGDSEGSGSTKVSEYRDFVKALVDASASTPSSSPATPWAAPSPSTTP